MEKQTQDLIIIGGGIMGLCTAYAASYFTNNIILLEKSRIGNPETASFGYTRSIRNDYLDPFYARLAYEARRLWLELERKATEPLIIQCGCLNIAKESVTPDLDATYAAQSYRTLTSLHLHTEAFTRYSSDFPNLLSIWRDWMSRPVFSISRQLRRRFWRSYSNVK